MPCTEVTVTPPTLVCSLGGERTSLLQVAAPAPRSTPLSRPAPAPPSQRWSSGFSPQRRGRSGGGRPGGATGVSKRGRREGGRMSWPGSPAAAAVTPLLSLASHQAGSCWLDIEGRRVNLVRLSRDSLPRTPAPSPGHTTLQPRSPARSRSAPG